MSIRDLIFGHPPDYETLEDKANGHARNGNFTKAEEVWRKLNQLYPDKAEPYSMIGAMRMQDDDFAAANEWFKKAADIEPRAIFSLNMGLAAKELGKPKVALKRFQQAVKLDPENIQARHNLAVATYQQGQFEASLKEWRWLANLLPGTHISEEFFSEIRRKVTVLEWRVERK